MARNWLTNGIIFFAVVAGVAGVAVLRQNRADSITVSGSSSVATGASTSAPSGLPRMVDLGTDKCIPCRKMPRSSLS